MLRCLKGASHGNQYVRRSPDRLRWIFRRRGRWNHRSTPRLVRSDAAPLPNSISRFPQLDFPHFTRRGRESPRIDLAIEPEFPPFRPLAGTWKIPRRPKYAANRRDRIAERWQSFIVPCRCMWANNGIGLAVNPCAQRATREYNPSSVGVVRGMARSDHCRCVSTPRCSRTSCKVVSMRQRNTKRLRIATGSRSRSVRRNAWGSRSAEGSRTRTQRIGAGG